MIKGVTFAIVAIMYMYFNSYYRYALWDLKQNKSLLFRQVGPRSKVWTEKEMLEISAWEFVEVSPFADSFRKKNIQYSKMANNCT